MVVLVSTKGETEFNGTEPEAKNTGKIAGAGKRGKSQIVFEL